MTAPVLDPRRSPSAPAPRRRPAPDAAPGAKPQLKVLRPDAAKDAEARRRFVVRVLAVTATVTAAVCVFSVVVFHVVLTQNQFRLDRLQDRALERQAEYDRQRLQVAQLESPDRIVADAQQRLGMVPAPRVVYLTPAVEDTPGGATASGNESGAADAGTSWSVVKPHLADG